MFWGFSGVWQQQHLHKQLTDGVVHQHYYYCLVLEYNSIQDGCSVNWWNYRHADVVHVKRFFQQHFILVLPQNLSNLHPFPCVCFLRVTFISIVQCIDTKDDQNNLFQQTHRLWKNKTFTMKWVVRISVPLPRMLRKVCLWWRFSMVLQCRWPASLSCVFQ